MLRGGGGESSTSTILPLDPDLDKIVEYEVNVKSIKGCLIELSKATKIMYDKGIGYVKTASAWSTSIDHMVTQVTPALNSSSFSAAVTHLGQIENIISAQETTQLQDVLENFHNALNSFITVDIEARKIFKKKFRKAKMDYEQGIQRIKTLQTAKRLDVMKLYAAEKERVRLRQIFEQSKLEYMQTLENILSKLSTDFLSMVLSWANSQSTLLGQGYSSLEGTKEYLSGLIDWCKGERVHHAEEMVQREKEWEERMASEDRVKFEPLIEVLCTPPFSIVRCIRDVERENALPAQFTTSAPVATVDNSRPRDTILLSSGPRNFSVSVLPSFVRVLDATTRASSTLSYLIKNEITAQGVRVGSSLLFANNPIALEILNELSRMYLLPYLKAILPSYISSIVFNPASYQSSSVDGIGRILGAVDDVLDFVVQKIDLLPPFYKAIISEIHQTLRNLLPSSRYPPVGIFFIGRVIAGAITDPHRFDLLNYNPPEAARSTLSFMAQFLGVISTNQTYPPSYPFGPQLNEYVMKWQDPLLLFWEKIERAGNTEWEPMTNRQAIEKEDLPKLKEFIRVNYTRLAQLLIPSNTPTESDIDLLDKLCSAMGQASNSETDLASFPASPVSSSTPSPPFGSTSPSNGHVSSSTQHSFISKLISSDKKPKIFAKHVPLNMVLAQAPPLLTSVPPQPQLPNSHIFFSVNNPDLDLSLEEVHNPSLIKQETSTDTTIPTPATPTPTPTPTLDLLPTPPPTPTPTKPSSSSTITALDSPPTIQPKIPPTLPPKSSRSTTLFSSLPTTKSPSIPIPPPKPSSPSSSFNSLPQKSPLPPSPSSSDSNEPQDPSLTTDNQTNNQSHDSPTNTNFSENDTEQAPKATPVAPPKPRRLTVAPTHKLAPSPHPSFASRFDSNESLDSSSTTIDNHNLTNNQSNDSSTNNTEQAPKATPIAPPKPRRLTVAPTHKLPPTPISPPLKSNNMSSFQGSIMVMSQVPPSLRSTSDLDLNTEQNTSLPIPPKRPIPRLPPSIQNNNNNNNPKVDNTTNNDSNNNNNNNNNNTNDVPVNNHSTPNNNYEGIPLSPALKPLPRKNPPLKPAIKSSSSISIQTPQTLTDNTTNDNDTTHSPNTTTTTSTPSTSLDSTTNTIPNTTNIPPPLVNVKIPPVKKLPAAPLKKPVPE